MFYISQSNSQLQWTSLPLLLALNYANLLSITALVFLLIMGDQHGHDVMHAVKLAVWGSKVDSSRHDGSHADNDIAFYGSPHRDTLSWEIHVAGSLCGESLKSGTWFNTKIVFYCFRKYHYIWIPIGAGSAWSWTSLPLAPFTNMEINWL